MHYCCFTPLSEQFYEDAIILVLDFLKKIEKSVLKNPNKQAHRMSQKVCRQATGAKFHFKIRTCQYLNKHN